MSNNINDSFWDHQRPESKVKAEIVSSYFPEYCKIVDGGKGGGFVYIDLLAGKGKYNDGNLSTPLLLADIIAKDTYLSEKVTFVFNDLYYKEELQKNFLERYGEHVFKQKVHWGDHNVETSETIKKYLNRRHDFSKVNTPKLLFFDPYGYAGIDTAGLANFMLPWGNEVFLFLNVNRILMHLTQIKVQHHIDLMFPTLKAQVISEIKQSRTDRVRASVLYKYLELEFRKIVGQNLQACAFKFMEHDANKTSHLVVHFTKHSKGFKLVKQVFYDYDNIGATLDSDGTFVFDAKKAYKGEHIGFVDEENIANLASDLLEQFNGKTITAEALIDDHQKKSNYATTQYVLALRKLYHEQQVSSRFTDEGEVKHQKTILPLKTCVLTFKPWQKVL